MVPTCRSGVSLASVVAAFLLIWAVASSPSAHAGHDHHHGDESDRDGKTVHVDGFNIDVDDPPRGSSVGRALAFVDSAYMQVVYGRPLKRDRMIFGGLVAHGQIWPMGAHMATEITLTEPVCIAGRTLSAGTYSLFATPEEDEWTIHVNSKLGMHLADRYDPDNDVLTFTVPVTTRDEITEQHTIDFEDQDRGVDLRVTWDDVRVRIPIRPLR